MPDHGAAPLFEEHQYLSRGWLRLLVLVSALLPIVLFAWGLIQQIGFRRPWGTNPMSDRALAITAVVMSVFCLLYLLFMSRLELYVRVEPDRVVIHYRPVLRRIIPLQQIEKAYARMYRPIVEYGGWGVRFWFRGYGRAYNAYGNRGVQLELTSGRRVLIGSQCADELAAAINQARASRMR